MPEQETAGYGKEHMDIFIALAMPFDADEVKQRTQAGRSFSYVTARTVANRLDDVVGPANWWTKFDHSDEHSVVCKLTVRLPDGREVTKEDAGAYAGMADPGDDDKSGYSDAIKRAASLWGVARYLYRDGVPNFAKVAFPNGQGDAAHQPSGGGSQQPQRPEPPRQASNGNGNGHQAPSPGGGEPNLNPPRTGRALFAWTKQQDEQHDYGLLKHLNAWSKRQDFPDRMIDWDGEQTVRAYAEACRKIKAILSSQDATNAVLGHGGEDAQAAPSNGHATPAPTGGNQPDTSTRPTNGGGLFGWCKDQEKNGFPDMVGTVNAIVQGKFGNVMMTKLSSDQVATVWGVIAGKAAAGNRAAAPAAAPVAVAAPTRAPMPPGPDGEYEEDDLPF